MNLNPETRIGDLLDDYPFLLEFLITVSPRYKTLKNPIMRKTIGGIATIAKAAKIGGFTTEYLKEKIEKEIQRKTIETTGESSTELATPSPEMDRKTQMEALRSIILDLHAGEDVDVARERFSKLIENINPQEIVSMEQSLIDDGMDASMLKGLSDVHVKIFKDSLEGQEMPQVSPGHPVHTYMKENRFSEGIIGEITMLLEKIGDPADENVFKESLEDVLALVEKLQMIDLHYLRKENQLFPMLESKGITGPSTVMWEVHDDIRAQLKKTKENAEKNALQGTIDGLKKSSQMIEEMIFKEEHILYPLSLENLSDEEWTKVRNGEEEIGYAWIQPEEGWSPAATEKVLPEGIKEAAFSLDTGRLTSEQMNLILKHLPVDVSFVDENDQMAYYSDIKDRIFPRSPGIIGRKVQKCHPPKSIQTVERIVDEFKKGTKDAAEFWIQLEGRFLLIRYFAVRNAEGNYVGTLEVSQDLTRLRTLEGEKRLLDWE